MRELVWGLLLAACLSQGAAAQDSENVVITGQNSIISRAGAAQFVISFPDVAGQEVALDLTRNCAPEPGLCIAPNGYFEFLLTGDARLELRASPERSETVNSRRFGVFRYDPDPTADVPPVYYDLTFVMIDAWDDFPALGPGAQAPDTLFAYGQFQEDWEAVVSLATGPKRGRIYIQPLFESTLSDIFAAPGTYSASIRLSIFER